MLLLDRVPHDQFGVNAKTARPSEVLPRGGLQGRPALHACACAAAAAQLQKKVGQSGDLAKGGFRELPSA